MQGTYGTHHTLSPVLGRVALLQDDYGCNMPLDLDGPEPLYRQVADVLAARIADGTYPPRRRIPSETEICEEFGIARPTARSAVHLLRGRGLVETSQGKGTFVIEPPADGAV